MPINKSTLSNTLSGWHKQLGIALLYLFSGYAINHNFTNYNIVCTFWPGAGLALASLLIGGKRYIWGIFLGSILLNIQSNESLWAAVGITLTHILEALCGMSLLARNNRSVLLLHTLRDYRLLIAGGGVASIAGAIIGTVVLLFAGYITTADYLINVLHWWMGDTLGVVLITPLMLAWGLEKPGKFNAKQLLESLFLTGMTFLAGQVVFLDWFHEYLSDTPKAYWMFLCVTSAGIRIGNRGGTFIIVMIAIQALFGAYYKVGYFADEIARANLYNYWAYMLILSVVGMTVTTYVNEIKRTLLRLQLKNSALNAAANGIVITDVEGRVEWANQAFSRLTGFSLNDEYSLNPCESVKPGNQDHGHYRSMWLTILANKVWHGELVNCRKDGSQYDEEMTITPLSNEQGEIMHFVAVKQDITERKQMENALRESEYRWKFAVEGSGDGLWDWNVADGTVFFSKRWKQMLGFSEDEIGDSLDEWEKRIHPDDKAETLAIIQAYLEGKTPIYISEHRVSCKDGSYKWILDRGMIVSRDAEDNPLRMVGTHSDISERKQMEAAREEALNRLQKIAGRVPGVVYQYRLRPDGSACFPFASEAIRDVYRVSPEDVREDAGKVLAVLHPDDYDGINASMQKSAQNLTPWCYEYRVKFDDGTVHWLFGNALPQREADGSTLWHGFISDITMRKRIEAKLRYSNVLNASILNSLTSHLVVLDTQGVIVTVNNAWRRFGKENGLPQSIHSMLGVNYLDICKNAFNQSYGDEAKSAHDGIEAVLSGDRESFYLEYACHSPDQQRWFLMNVSPLRGLRRGVVVSHENITLRKLAELALQQSENRYRALLQDASDAILITDMNGNLEEINRAGELLLGYNREQICRMSAAQIHPADEQTKVRQHFDNLLINGIVESLETKVLCKDGRIIDIEIRPTLSEISGRKMAQATFIDLTERKRIEKDRLSREKAQRDALVREVHHRIKNNLQGITGILRQFADSHPETAELLNHAISQVQSVAIVHGLQGRTSLTNIRVCELTVAIAAGFESMWHKPVTVETPDPWIAFTITETEAVPLALVINELVCNAVKHGEAGQPVSITLSREQHLDLLRLTIHNTGLIPDGFGLENAGVFGTGLQLVASLLPRAGAKLTWAQQLGIVITTLDLNKPVVQQEATH